MGQSVDRALAAGIETASLPPGVSFDEHEVGLPRVLSAADTATYRSIYTLQKRGDWRGADHEMARLADPVLVASLLADRYLDSRYRTSYAELATWLERNADHPDAPALYRLAQSRRPAGGKALTRPATDNLSAGGWLADDFSLPPTEVAIPTRKLSGKDQQRAARLKADIRAAIRAGSPAAADRHLASAAAATLLSDEEFDQLRGLVAAAYVPMAEDGRAFALARAAAERSGHIVPRNHWIAGLAAWRLGRYDDAGHHFETLAITSAALPWDQAAGAFWAARVHFRSNRMKMVNYWLAQATSQPRTFYGLLARRIQDRPSEFNWDGQTLTQADVDMLVEVPGAKRALALIQLDRSDEAEAELRRLYPNSGPLLGRALLAVALRSNMVGLSMRLGRELSERDGRRHDDALYPVPRWRPQGGFIIDRPLIYSLMRQESGFNPTARSPAGAQGLMQLMPQTAAYIARQSGYTGPLNLHDPVVNLTLGQAYIRHLLDNDIVQGDLIRLAAAYNSGPGNLQRWEQQMEGKNGAVEDALVFMESLPAAETRQFIQRFLFNYWIYSERLDLPSPALDDLARGQWPTYASVDAVVKQVAQDAKTR